MLFKTRLFIIGICIVFLVIRSQGTDNATPVNNDQEVESVVDVNDLNSLCAEDPTELRVHTIFEDEVWCYQA